RSRASILEHSDSRPVTPTARVRGYARAASRLQILEMRQIRARCGNVGGMLTPVLTDGVVRLSGFTLDDVAAHLANEDDEIARRCGWWPRRSNAENVRAAICRWIDAWATGGATRVFAVREVATGNLVGHSELRVYDDNVAHASYSTAVASRRRGF